jgi:hypothetical protein
MSVYEETGAGYLIRTKDLNLSCDSHASRRRDKVVSPRQRSLATYA